jgi:hypothetical protein
MEMVPDTLAELILPPAHPPASVEGTARFTTAVPANEPVALPSLIRVRAMPPCGHALAFHVITAESGAFVGDKEHVKGLEANLPVRRAE